ncbi:M23 family metallopeptidase [Ralstonia insidiosa]|uniref:M23 family metallopeptidase n=1 Tax=Ralstonia insidiosa TaxID=190721 RepID=UPI000CEE226B|nr:M23 family metallopeptidase [Ralstonia insidiosa]
MLISYPILETPQANDTEETLLARMLARATSPAGQYPANTIGQYKVWHGGLHLDATNATPIRAIADGMIVAYRQAQTSEQYQNQPYDTSFVLIKHETESGENTPVVFYSLYMHLASRDALTPDQIGSLPALFQQAAAMGPDAKSPPNSTAAQRKQARVYRKDILGYPGLQYGQTDRRVHFEVFTTEEHLNRFWKDSSTATNQTASADFYGDAHFIIPANKTFAARHPNAVQPHRIRFDAHHFYDLEVGQAGTSSEQLIVSVRLDKGTRTATSYVKQGDAYRALGGGTVGTPVVQSDYEYEFFRLATALYPDCPSAGFEWLRFGRILSSDTTTTNQNWQLVRYSDGATGYIDLAQTDIVALSDADFPFWRGWEKIQEGQLANPSDAFVDDPHALTLLNDTINEPGRQKLRHLVVKHPSEWDASDLATRYAKLRATGKSLESQESWQAFEDHVQKMAFWDKTGGLDRSIWHFHPLEFIFHYRKCGWLNLGELASTFPRHMFYSPSGNPRTANTTNSATFKLTEAEARDRVRNHAVSLNRCIRKYIGNGKHRAALFLAQTLLETAQWRNLGGNKRLMHEWGFGQYSSANPATQYYTAFYGRGIMQLTWAGNYRDYGDFRALANHVGAYVERLTPANPRITATSRHYTANPSDNGQLIQWSPRFDPDIVGEDNHAACDSGGFYWVSKSFSEGLSINRVCDRGYSAENVGFINRLVNGGGNGYYERQAYSVYILRMLTDSIDVGQTVIISPPAPKSGVQADMRRPE